MNLKQAEALLDVMWCRQIGEDSSKAMKRLLSVVDDAPENSKPTQPERPKAVDRHLDCAQKYPKSDMLDAANYLLALEKRLEYEEVKNTPVPDNPWREVVLKQCGYFGLSTFSEDPEKAMGQLRQAIEKEARFEAVNSTHAQPDLAELICRHQIHIELNGVVSAFDKFGNHIIKGYDNNDPASLRAAIERLVGRIEG
jgi:hypothetical protein